MSATTRDLTKPATGAANSGTRKQNAGKGADPTKEGESLSEEIRGTEGGLDRARQTEEEGGKTLGADAGMRVTIREGEEAKERTVGNATGGTASKTGKKTMEDHLNPTFSTIKMKTKKKKLSTIKKNDSLIISFDSNSSYD